MDITEIRIKLMDDPNDRLQAFCSITFDGCFVIRDLKIIAGTKGPFVAMPSRKLTDRCPRCSSKNQLRARFCNDCGAKLMEERACKADDGRAKLYADIAHPINSDCRDLIQRKVLEAFAIELDRSRLPGYVCMYDDYGEESYATLSDDSEEMVEVRAIVSMSEGLRRRDGANGYPAATPHHALARNGHRDNGNGRVAVMHRIDGEEEGFGAGLM
ncbi:MAG: SpoVG family protein [Planctomycetaceae bacterium]|nr:SpoVG family protein [Planctomycetaceae bacterium]